LWGINGESHSVIKLTTKWLSEEINLKKTIHPVIFFVLVSYANKDIFVEEEKSFCHFLTSVV
tara:strand:+ start:12273 stop:12458 length:186 start_codon:yes stop_codon:yes gene_type:complete